MNSLFFSSQLFSTLFISSLLVSSRLRLGIPQRQAHKEIQRSWIVTMHSSEKDEINKKDMRGRKKSERANRIGYGLPDIQPQLYKPMFCPGWWHWRTAETLRHPPVYGKPIYNTEIQQ